MSGILGAAVGAVGGLANIGMGIADRIKGNKKLKSAQNFYEKNKYAIPESAKAALSSAERQASGVRLPAEDLRRAQIGEATSQGLGAAQQAASSGSDVLGVLSGLYGQQQQMEQGMAISGAERFDRNQSMLRSELGRMSDLEREKWQYNSLYPYQQMLGQAEALQGRGAEGIGMGMNALGQAAGGYVQLRSAEQQNQEFEDRMGLNSWQPTTMSGARIQRDVLRRDLPSYNMKEDDGFNSPRYRTELKKQNYSR